MRSGVSPGSYGPFTPIEPMENVKKPSSGLRRGTGANALFGVGAAMVAVGALIHVLFVPSAGVADAPFLVPWWALALAFVVFERAVVIVRVQRDPHTVSLSDVPLVMGLLLAAPGALIAARVVGSAVALMLNRRSAPKVAFNLGMHYLEVVAAIAVLRVALGDSSGGGLAAWVLVLAAHALSTVLSVTLVMAAIRLTDRRRQISEIARSLRTGFLISFGAGVVSVMFLAAAWSDPWALLVIGAVTLMLYLALKVFGTLSDRHSELLSIHAFNTAVVMQESEATLAESTLREIARTFGVGTVEIAAHHSTRDGRRWFYSRLNDDEFVSSIDDEAGIGHLIGNLAGRGVVAVSDLEPGTASRLASRGCGDGLVNGFHPNGLAGYIAIGSRDADRRSLDRNRPLFETFTGPLVANLERVALVEALRSEIDTKEHQRLHDSLTGLLNRAGFIEHLEASLAEDDGLMAVAVIDLDHFQEVNDVFGPERGDAVLREIAERLGDSIRSADVLARLDGDEFAVLFREVRGKDATVALARRIGDAFLLPFDLDGVSITLGASTGIAVFPHHGNDADTLLRRADMARSIAKNTRGMVEIFDIEQDLAAERRLVLANDLRPAIESCDVRVEYQPKLLMESGRTMGFEALARWTHHDLGHISPIEFINLAQHAGVIAPLTFSVLEQSLEQVALWREDDPSLSVSVNIAAEVLAEEDFADRVSQALQAHGLMPDALILEITESQSLADDRRTRDSVLRLAAAGIVLSIDDFGTGYAALSYLQNLPVGEVKIDRTFVTRMAEHPGDRAIVAGTIQLLHSVGLRVVAEGIESRDVWDLLAELGCYAAQGYLMSKPLPPEEAAAWVTAPAWNLAIDTAR